MPRIVESPTMSTEPRLAAATGVGETTAAAVPAATSNSPARHRTIRTTRTLPAAPRGAARASAMGDFPVTRDREVAQRSGGGRRGQRGVGAGPAQASSSTRTSVWAFDRTQTRPNAPSGMAAMAVVGPGLLEPELHGRRQPAATDVDASRCARCRPRSPVPRRATADCAAGARPATRTRSSRPAPSGRRRRSPSATRVSASTVDRHGWLRVPAGGGVPVSGRPGRVPAALAGAQRTRVAGVPGRAPRRDPGQLRPDEAGQLHGTAGPEVDRVEEPGVAARAVAVPRRHPQQRRGPVERGQRGVDRLVASLGRSRHGRRDPSGRATRSAGHPGPRAGSRTPVASAAEPAGVVVVARHDDHGIAEVAGRGGDHVGHRGRHLAPPRASGGGRSAAHPRV